MDVSLSKAVTTYFVGPVCSSGGFQDNVTDEEVIFSIVISPGRYGATTINEFKFIKKTKNKQTKKQNNKNKTKLELSVARKNIIILYKKIPSVLVWNIEF